MKKPALLLLRTSKKVMQYAMLQCSAQLFVLALVRAFADFLCESVIL